MQTGHVCNGCIMQHFRGVCISDWEVCNVCIKVGALNNYASLVSDRVEEPPF